MPLDATMMIYRRGRLIYHMYIDIGLSVKIDDSTLYYTNTYA